MIHPDVPIDLARRSDVVDIACLSRELVEKGLRWSWTPSRVAASVASPNALVVVARAACRIAGFAVMRYGDEEAHLDLLGVAEDHRREGVGRRLVEWLQKPALLAGIPAVFLEVRESNHGARAFYERLGYRALGRIAGYYQGCESAVRMARNLGCGADSASHAWVTRAGALRQTRPPGPGR